MSLGNAPIGSTGRNMGDRVAEFERLFESTLQKGTGGVIQYDLPYPKHEFLTYLTSTWEVLLHGSNDTGLAVLLPHLAHDYAKYSGNAKAVYAMNEAIVPIFFSITRFNKLTGPLMCLHSSLKKGTKRYHFVMSTSDVKRKPWAGGMVYILPAKDFHRICMNDGVLADEWICRKKVRPLASLRVGPGDFPYWNEIETYDEPKPFLEPWEKRLQEKTRKSYKNKHSTIHSWEHTLRVVRNARLLAKLMCPHHLKAVLTAAYLHDIGRIDDNPGPAHALRSARMASQFYPTGLTDRERKSIRFAIANHGDRRSPEGGFPTTRNYREIGERALIEPIIAALWDADRLDMSRCGPVSTKYLSSAMAKRILKHGLP